MWKQLTTIIYKDYCYVSYVGSEFYIIISLFYIVFLIIYYIKINIEYFKNKKMVFVISLNLHLANYTLTYRWFHQCLFAINSWINLCILMII